MAQDPEREERGPAGRASAPGAFDASGDARGREISAEQRELIVAENLARDAGLALFREMRAGGVSRTCVFAGVRANGRAGLFAARHLANLGVPTTVYQAGRVGKSSAEVVAAWKTLERMGIPPVEILDPDEAAGAASDLPSNAGAVLAAREEPVKGTVLPSRGEQVGEALDFSLKGRPHLHRLEVRADYRSSPPDLAAETRKIETRPRSREEARLLDGAAIDGLGIPSLSLMENAGRAVADEAWRMLQGKGEVASARVVVLVGRGNNGGDGFVAARHLAWWGVSVFVYLLGLRERVMDDARVNMTCLEEAGPRVRPIADPTETDWLGETIAAGTLVVDAILGTGISGKVQPPVARLIEMINASGVPVLAVDAPSGLDCTTGEVLGTAVRATRTVTFAAPKTGFLKGAGPEHVGELLVADIGIPPEVTA